VAVVGASGAVGSQLVELIFERGLNFGSLGLFASSANDAPNVESAGQEQRVEHLEDFQALAEFDLAFLAVPAQVALEIAAARLGSMLIDISGACEDHPGAALVAPGFTPRQRLLELQARGAVFVTPHPVALVTATILRALGVESGLVSAVAMLGASSLGKHRARQAIIQSAAALNGELDLADGETQLAFNLCLSPDRDRLARTVSRQVAGLVGRAPELALQSVQVPVLHGAALSLCVPQAQGAADWRERLRSAPGVLFEKGEPAGLIDAVNQEAIVVSVAEEKSARLLWCVFDNLRLAALAALWTAENAIFAGQAAT
jgi:aspartate-semialdehyde dehydrogenase